MNSRDNLSFFAVKTRTACFLSLFGCLWKWLAGLTRWRRVFMCTSKWFISTFPITFNFHIFLEGGLSMIYTYNWFFKGTLLANVLLGYLLRNRICSCKKLVSILLVTLGVVLFTMADEFSKQEIAVEKERKVVHSWRMLPSNIGMFFRVLLLVALCGSL